MCDDDIHQGQVFDPGLSRRAFGLGAAVSASLSAVAARAEGLTHAKDVEIKTADGVADAALFHPVGGGKHPAVLIWTDFLGLRPVFRDMGRRLAAQGYVVLVPNPYYRQARAPVVGPDASPADPAVRQRGMSLMATLTPEGADVDSRAFLAFLDAQPQTDTRRRAGVQGYCMGGPLAFHTAALAPERVGALATFHGAALVTDKPASPHLLIPRMKAEALIDIAANDDAREPASKDVLRKAFAEAQRPALVQVYDGCNHGWCVRGAAVYNEAGAERAWGELSALYTRTLA